MPRRVGNGEGPHLLAAFCVHRPQDHQRVIAVRVDDALDLAFDVRGQAGEYRRAGPAFRKRLAVDRSVLPARRKEKPPRNLLLPVAHDVSAAIWLCARHLKTLLFRCTAAMISGGLKASQPATSSRSPGLSKVATACFDAPLSGRPVCQQAQAHSERISPKLPGGATLRVFPWDKSGIHRVDYRGRAR